MFAEVIIPLALPKNYTWAVPPGMESTIRPGCRVEVNLGRQKKYAGIVKRLHEEHPRTFEPKQIISVLDEAPVIHSYQLKLWEWMASYYLCTEGEVMAAALPAHFRISSETILLFNEEYGDDFTELDHDEFLLAEALLLKQELKLSEIQKILDSPHVYPVVNRLIEKRVCFVQESLKETYQPKKESYVILNAEYDNEESLAELLNNWKRAPRQLELLLAYLHFRQTAGEVTRSALLGKSGATDAQLKGLCDKGVLRVEKRQVNRLHYASPAIRVDFELSTAQQAALEETLGGLQKGVCLLHGVTSSGKTHIYIKIIEQYIREGRQVLYLLPEIALTSQIIRRLQKHFGGHIGIYHSRFSQNERVEIWNRVHSGEMKVVLGARSALFLSFANLGLIICDEEHDSSFKQQDPAPRYHGRDTAIYLGSLLNARVLLGSATPSVESYFNATRGKYTLVELKERFGDVNMPSIEFLDSRRVSVKRGERVMISPPLHDAIRTSISHGRQVILFQNRRGYTPYQFCMVCGWIAQCRNCDVSLTYHKLTNRLKCHYCGNSYPPSVSCQACGSDRLVQKNFGTEKVEELLHELMPGIRIARMDLDSVRTRHAHDVLIRQFEQKQLDVLVGTQMVVKGLDFDNVELVGILDADSLLNFADFRVNERAFQLMEQVSGRCGRRDGRGHVMIQTINPAHPVLSYVSMHDYLALYAEEIEKRRQFFYPPFSRIIMLHFRHKDKETVRDAAHIFAEAMTQSYGKYLVGPAEPVVNRVRDKYLMELMLKLPRDSTVAAACRAHIREEMAKLRSVRRFSRLVIIPDADPV